MTKYIIGEIFSSGGATLYKNCSDQTVFCLHSFSFSTASSSDLSIKRYANNKDNNGNHDSGSDVTTSSGGNGGDHRNHHSEFCRTFGSSSNTSQPSVSSATTSNTHLGLYREPRLNKSDSASLSVNGLHNTNRFQTANHHSVPLSPNSIDNRYVFLQNLHMYL